MNLTNSSHNWEQQRRLKRVAHSLARSLDRQVLPFSADYLSDCPASQGVIVLVRNRMIWGILATANAKKSLSMLIDGEQDDALALADHWFVYPVASSETAFLLAEEMRQWVHSALD